MIAEKKKKWKRARLLILLSVVALLNLFPLVWLLDYSLLSNSDFYGDSIMKLPAPPLWSNYFSAIVDGKFFNYLLNSLFITGITIAVVITLSICLGYALIRMKWKGSRFVYTLLITGIMIPIHTTLLPNFFVGYMVTLPKKYFTFGITTVNAPNPSHRLSKANNPLLPARVD